MAIQNSDGKKVSVVVGKRNQTELEEGQLSIFQRIKDKFKKKDI